jgi:HEPN domain-containing protein
MKTDNQLAAEKLLAIAKRDAASAWSLSQSNPDFAEQIGFHCQQGVEKSIKSILAFHNIDYPYTHNLAILNRIAETNSIQLPAAFSESESLTPFAMSVRYDGLDSGDIPNVPNMLALTKACVEFAESEIT